MNLDLDPMPKIRMKAVFMLLALCVLIAFGTRADSLAGDAGKDKVRSEVQLKVRAFPLGTVRVLDGPFKHAMEMDEAYLLVLDIDRLLHNFRLNAGLPSSAQPVGGWEAPDCELRGHFVGHFLSACALMYASTGDERFKRKGDAVVAGLAECQAKLGSGYLSAFPESFIDRVEKRVPVWAPYYTLHKIFGGLEDMYVYCGNQQALQVAGKFGDWAIARNSRLTDEQMQAMLQTEHGGMNETLANLYALTGEKKYLDLSLRFNHHRLLDPAENQQDTLTGLHANTQIPKFIGNARQFELTGQAPLGTAAKFFWQTVANERSYVIGGHSDGEMFSPKEHLSQALGPNTTETCNTYNMLKLTRHLFCLDPRAEYGDYYERALYNHILASQNPDTGMMCYYVPLRSGSSRTYNGTNDSFWCCTGTGVENHAKYADSIYFHDDQNLYVDLFIASELNWLEKGLVLHQETKYPDEGSTRLTFRCTKPVRLSLRIRHPAWAKDQFVISLNGKALKLKSEPGAFAEVTRRWRSGDRVEIQMPFTLRTEAFKDNSDRFAILAGPLVLCAEVDARKPFPAVTCEKSALLASLQALPGRPNTFRGSGDIFLRPDDDPNPGVMLFPFYQAASQHYEVYWDRFSPSDWTKKREDYKAELLRQHELDARTVDSVSAGQEQEERDHHFAGEHTDTREIRDRTVRFAETNGWFSWDLKVLPDQPQELSVDFAGGGRGGSTVEVLVDDNKLASERPAGQADQPGFANRIYALSGEVLKGKEKITVKFQAPGPRRTAGVSSARILKTAAPTQR